MMTLNRLSGLLAILFGLILFFWIIPSQTETVDTGWLKPHTLPDAVALFICALGLIHFIVPTGEAQIDWGLSLRIGLFVLITLAGLYLMSLVGFLIAAPVLMAVLMLMIGERRILWLIMGIVFLPGVIWLAVEVLLHRPLP